MAWTKDDSNAPVIVYTDSEHPQTITYDPNASRPICVEMDYLHFEGETLDDVEASLGLV